METRQDRALSEKKRPNLHSSFHVPAEFSDSPSSPLAHQQGISPEHHSLHPRSSDVESPSFNPALRQSAPFGTIEQTTRSRSPPPFRPSPSQSLQQESLIDLEEEASAEVVIDRSAEGTYHLDPVRNLEQDFRLPAEYSEYEAHRPRPKPHVPLEQHSREVCDQPQPFRLPPLQPHPRSPFSTQNSKSQLPTQDPRVQQQEFRDLRSQRRSPPFEKEQDFYEPRPLRRPEPRVPDQPSHYPQIAPQDNMNMQEVLHALQSSVVQGMAAVTQEITKSLVRIEQRIDQRTPSHQGYSSSMADTRPKVPTRVTPDLSDIPSISQQRAPPPPSRHEHSRDAHRYKSRHRRPQRASSDSSESEDGHSSTSRFSRSRTARNPSQHTAYAHSPRLPSFTGQEDWKVYHNRFEAVAAQQNWSESRKLTELLPRLQGKAGDFVFGQLGPSVHNNYRLLCKELKNRFRVVETARTFSAKFSSRDQIAGESVQDYAAELKRLYDKAHANRDRQTRQEDLLRRFLDGLNDERARFQVEFVKQPDDIDSAVYEVVSCQETKKRINSDHDKKSKKPTRAVGTEDSPSDTENTDSDEEIRAVHPNSGNNGKARKGHLAHKPHPQNQPKAPNGPAPKKTESKDANSEVLQQLMTTVAQLEESLSKMTKPNPPSPPEKLPPRCYRCGELGHFIRECPVSPGPVSTRPTANNSVNPTQDRNVSTNYQGSV